ncbi:hypothetical protein [Microbacterium sp. SS28]|uniref:hypothetical protein n=1 Tax=Microbacterium sp. SS28 TaxID=2919948 RepID=UPI001FAA2C32|nr:hypothetical protein [Microbacterium sp. SS28]
MSRRGWAILVGVVAIAVVAGLVIWAFASGPGEAEPSATPTATPAPTTTTPTDAASPSPTLTPVAPPAVATCETISTAEFQAMMAQNGWVSWETQDEQIGARPFDRFPDGAPAGQIVCRWGESPDLATDNIEDLAWAPIGTDAAVAAQAALVDEGFERIEAPEGVYLALVGAGDWSDAEGYGETYLFTDDDVRWARTKADVVFVTAPDEQG